MPHMNPILESILIGLTLLLTPFVVLSLIAVVLIIKNLVICFWRATEGEREELKTKILTKLGKVEKTND